MDGKTVGGGRCCCWSRFIADVDGAAAAAAAADDGEGCIRLLSAVALASFFNNRERGGNS